MRGEVMENNKYIIFKVSGKEYKLDQIKLKDNRAVGHYEKC